MVDKSGKKRPNSKSAAKKNPRSLKSETVGSDRNGNPAETGPKEMLLHELHVHQVELELQNEELRDAQEKLELSRARYLDLYDFAPVGYITTNRSGTILQANLTAATLLGVARGLLVRTSLSSYVVDQEIFYNHKLKFSKVGDSHACQLRLLRNSGTPFWARLDTTMQPGFEADPVVLQTAISDISDQKRYEQALQESRSFLMNLIGSAGAPIVVWDKLGRISHFNAAFENITGLPAVEMIGRSIQSIFPYKTCIDLLLRRGRQANIDWEGVEIPIEHRNGTVRSLLWYSAEVCGADDQTPVATVAQGVDITERKQAEEGMRLKALMEQREHFVAMLTHDLKSPLRACMRMVDLFLDGSLGALTSEQNAGLALLKASNASLLSLVENLLDVYRIEGGAYTPRLQRTDLQELIKASCREVASIAAGRNLCFDIDLPPEGIQPVEIDGLAFKRVLQNLLDNAQKYTPDGGSIFIAARRCNGEICIDVGDTGPGICAEDEERLFERFWQGKAERNYRAGIGLGLYLCHHLISAHGGRLTYKRREGGGSVFTATVPAKVSEDIEDRSTSGKGAIKIVLVEDNAISRVVLRMLLEQSGQFNIMSECADGKSACQKIPELNPAIVMLDIGLPDMSGIEVCKRLKSSHPDMHILMFTSHEAPAEVMASFAAGADGYCLKDVSKEDLVVAISSIASGTSWLDPRVKAHWHAVEDPAELH